MKTKIKISETELVGQIGRMIDMGGGYYGHGRIYIASDGHVYPYEPEIGWWAVIDLSRYAGDYPVSALAGTASAIAWDWLPYNCDHVGGDTWALRDEDED